MFASSAISRQIETIRKNDPEYLTSKTVTLGSLVTKGEHLFLDRTHPKWKKALSMLINQMQKTVQEQEASQLMLRDFITNRDEELKAEMLKLGFSETELLETCICNDLTWTDEADYLKRLGQKYRYNVRKEILKFKDKFRLETTKPSTQAEIETCYQLFCNVHEKAFEFNVHLLPLSYFEMMNESSDYDILRLYLKDDPRPSNEQKPVAVMYSFNKGGTYNAMMGWARL